MLVFGFGVAAVATVWVMVLAVVILYVCSIIMVRMVRTIDTEDEYYELFQANFGSIGMSMYTFFSLMLNPDLTKYEGAMGKFILISMFLFVFVVFGSFGMLALLTGVISESMFEKNQARLEEERGEREQRRKLLSDVSGDMFDEIAEETADGNPDVAVEELKKKIPNLIDVFLKYGFALTEYDLQGVLDVTDTDDSGGINRSEFVHAICSCADGVQASTVMELGQNVVLIGVKAEKRHELLMAEMHAMFSPIKETLESLGGRIDALAGIHNELGEHRKGLSPEGTQTTITPESPKPSGQQSALPADFLEQLRLSQEQLLSRMPTQEQLMSRIPAQSPTRNTGSSLYIGLDSKLALKIDSCEAMVREIRRTVSEVAETSREIIMRTPIPSGGLVPVAPCLSRASEPWSENEFAAPLEIPDMWQPASRGEPNGLSHEGTKQGEPPARAVTPRPGAFNTAPA